MAPAPVGTAGTPVYSASTVVTPTTLTPDTGSGYSIGDTLICFTVSGVALAATVATPSGWTKILDVTGSSLYRMVLFAKVAASTTEAAPSVVWSNLTTGASGDPVGAIIRGFSGLDTSDLTTLAEVTGTVTQGSTSSTVTASTPAITTTTDNDLILSLAVRADDVANTWDALTSFGFTNVSGGAGAGGAMNSQSGHDFAAQWAYKVKSPAGSSASHFYSLSGGTITAQTSAGVQIALKPATVPSVPVNTAAPVISGTRVVGQTLTTTNGSWSNSPTSFTYQWQRDGTNIGSATSNTYVLVTADAGHAVTCLVTAVNGSGSSAPAASNSLTAVAEIIAADVQFWTAASGGLGGAPGAQITDPTSVFDSVTNAEAVAGDVEYRAVYLKNTHAVRSLTLTLAWISSQTSSTTTDLAIAIAAEAAGSNVTSIANESTPPATVTFSAPASEGAGLSIGTLAAGQARGVWLRRTINAATTPVDVDTCTLAWSGTPA